MTTKEMSELEKKFVVSKFMADGCPEDDAKAETWESMVENLFDGDEEAAKQELELFN